MTINITEKIPVKNIMSPFIKSNGNKVNQGTSNLVRIKEQAEGKHPRTKRGEKGQNNIHQHTAK